MAFRIENGIPIPPVKRGAPPRTSKYPFAQMTAGQSVAVPLPAVKKLAQRSKASVLNAVARVAQARPDAKFTTRSLVENGKPVFRVWRVAPSNSGVS